MQDLKAKLKAVLNIRLIAWFIGLALIIGSIIYFTGVGGKSYKGLAVPEGVKLPGGTDVRSCEEWEKVFEDSWMNFINSENLQKAQENYLTYQSHTNVYFQGPTCPAGTIATSYIDPEMSLPKQHLENAKNICDQFVSDLEAAITDKTFDKYTEAYEKTGTLLGKDNIALKNFCLDDSQKQKYSDAKASLEQEKNTAVLMKSKSLLSGSSMALGGIAETTPVPTESLQTEAEPPETEDASSTPGQTEELAGKGLRGEAVETETATTAEEIGAEAHKADADTGTDTAKDNMIANVDKCTTAEMQLGQAKTDFNAGPPTNANLDVFKNLLNGFLETHKNCDLSSYQAMISDMEAKVQASELEQQEQNKKACEELKTQVKSALDSFYSDMTKENLSNFTAAAENAPIECDITDYVKQLPVMESRLATCENTQKTLEDLKTAFETDQTITMKNLNRYKLTIDESQKGCDVEQYKEHLSKMEANVVVENQDILELKTEPPQDEKPAEPAAEPEPPQTEPEPLIPEEPTKLTDTKQSLITPKELIGFTPPAEEPEPAEEKKLIAPKKPKTNLPAWGAEGEWEQPAPAPLAAVTAIPAATAPAASQPAQPTQSPQLDQLTKQLQALKSQISQLETKTGKQKSSAKKVVKKKKPVAAKIVKKTTGTGPATIVYLLFTAASYGASRLIRKRRS